jgi:hypothetical protein
VQQIGRNRVGRDLATEGFAAPGKDLVIAVKHGDRAARACIQKCVHVGQLGVEVEDHAAKDQRADNRKAPDNGPDHAEDKAEQA